MTFPPDLEEKLGFKQVRVLLKNNCLCTLGQRLVDDMGFMTAYAEISRVMQQHREMTLIIQKGDPFPFSNYFDPGELLPIIALEGSFVEQESFQQLILSLRSSLEARSFLIKNHEEYPALAERAGQMGFSASLLKSIDSKFDENGKLKNDATPELFRIRKKLEEQRSRTRKLVDQIYRHASSQGWVPDGVSPTIRDGRVVIPLNAENKRKVRGFIMDESATGQTVYVEPAEVLEANNDIRDLELAERKEIVTILKALTSSLRDNLPHVNEAYGFLAILDFNRAKAKLAVFLHAEVPRTAAEPGLRWIDARHPLLEMSLRGKRPIVPLNIHLASSERFLLVSGPNAGGKSVCLKTVGLIQYMFQCGLMVPVDERSNFGVFQRMFIDIGDQQSIENDLSTYSSHLRNLNHFLLHADEKSLVLMDELGSGTDPNFGGGIAQAVLSKLVEKKVWGMATTHYFNLKLFASRTSGIVNGAMLFDAGKMEPLFTLEIGKPGSSFALEIARKTGLPPETINEAESIIGKDLAGLETLMKTVADEKIANTLRSADLDRRKKELDEKMSRYEELDSQLQSRKKEIIDKAKDEASGLLRETNREIEKTIRHIRENKAEKRETRKVRDGLKGLQAKVERTRKTQAPHPPEKLDEGDRVRIIGQEVSGTLRQIKGKTAIVQFGDIRTVTSLDLLVRSDQVEVAPQGRSRAAGLDINEKQSHFNETLDVRGKRVEEVIPVLEQFLDDAVLLGRDKVSILHGKGEGVLRKVVRDHLTKVKTVASFASENVERGGEGITLVVLK